MLIASAFQDFCQSIKFVENENWLKRMQQITKKINYKYYGNENNISDHRLRVGSTGRHTATNDVSDYDILFNLPWSTYKKFNSHKHGQSDLLQEIKNCVKESYYNTEIRGDGQVVDVKFNDGLIEIIPGFKNDDGSFQYPDTHQGGSWRKTNPLPEKKFCKLDDHASNGTFRDLTRMIRVWKNHKGFIFKGLLIDTLVHNFYIENKDWINDCTYANYPLLMKKLYMYLSKQSTTQGCWFALGSQQRVDNQEDTHFISKAKSASDKLSSINLNNDNDVFKIFRELFGNKFNVVIKKSRSEVDEQFATSYFKAVDIQGTFDISCTVSKSGFRGHSIEFFKKKYHHLLKLSKLIFEVENINLPPKYAVENVNYYWKIRNYGDEARNSNCLRGEIRKGSKQHKETTKYANLGHYVECFMVVNNVVIARSKINVPIGRDSHAK
ncbi:SMODS domain-containing nucleotidyltransferase [Lentilactobacillus sp. SPB1-3]|uniref:Nucleotidyltransferase n=1 Tax=Lentilactobacillus terminaliae TaxID=3003483 RepID=A0ACD5DFW2_9LACO|nr:nucleotidyltransferase [Lentilactobacillus sp. SPB1-3]MCZ0976672.1 nucleotidyltransferase [Lentilactobacillus sp. SPB1-3]